jgi:hypothetical protein
LGLPRDGLENTQTEETMTKPKAGEPSNQELIAWWVKDGPGAYFKAFAPGEYQEAWLRFARRVWRECRERTLEAAIDEISMMSCTCSARLRALAARKET